MLPERPLGGATLAVWLSLIPCGRQSSADGRPSGPESPQRTVVAARRAAFYATQRFQAD